MAQKHFYRLLNLSTGTISLESYVYDGYVSLGDVIVEYDDQLTPAHAKMVADAIDKRVKKMNADIVVMQNKKQDFLAIAYSAPQEPSPGEPQWEEVDDDKIPF